MTTLLTTAEVAAAAGVSIRTVHRRVISGRLKSQQLPGETGAYLFRLADVRKAFPAAEQAKQGTAA